MSSELDYELKLLERLVSIDTDVTKKAGYKECANVIVDELRSLGIEPEVLDSSAVAGDGISRPNIVATIDFNADKTVGLVSHYDVVPPGNGWSYPPFKLTIVNEKAYGRGTVDDKGGIVISIGVVKELMRLGKRHKYNVMLIITPEEEVGGALGLGYVLKAGIKCDYAIIVDGGLEAVYVGASGIIHGEIAVKGVQGHAGYPHMALNPIPPLAKVINKFEEFVKMRESKLSFLNAPPESPKEKVWGRFSFTILRAGEKDNVIPGVAKAIFDMRLIPEEDMVKAEEELISFVNKLKEELGITIELSILERCRNYYTSLDEPFVREFLSAARSVYDEKLGLAAELGANDGRYFAKVGIPVITFGPIRKDTRFHGVDEFIYLDDIKRVKDVFVNFIQA